MMAEIEDEWTVVQTPEPAVTPKPEPVKTPGKLAGDKLQAAAIAALMAQIRLAREDPAAFVEFVMRTPKGESIKLEYFHREWLNYMKNESRILIEAPRSHGKTSIAIGFSLWALGNNPNLRIKFICLAEGSMVHLKRGAVPVEQVVPGDEVLSMNNTTQVYTTVKRAWPTGTNKTIQIKTPRRTITVTAQHRLLVVDLNHKDIRWKQAQHIKHGDILVSLAENIARVDPLTSKKDLDDARAVGYFLGDGCWTPYRLDFSCSKASVRAKYVPILTRVFGKPPSCGKQALAICSKAICDKWVARGLAKTTFEKELPTWVWGKSRAYKLALLEGFVDSDGTRGRGFEEFFGSNKRLIEQLRILAMECGVPVANIRPQKSKPPYRACWRVKYSVEAGKQRHENAYRVTLGTNYIPSWLKLPKGFTIEKVITSTVGNVVPTYDLEVAEATHAYVAEGLVSHNCQNNDKAKERLYEFRTNIESNPALKLVFPDLKQAEVGEWTKTKLYVERTAKTRDPSFEAIGVTTSLTGGRIDILFCDDVCDIRNSILYPSMREDIKQKFFGEIVPTLEADGKIIYVATPYHNADLTSTLKSNPQWIYRHYQIGDDKDQFKPLWPARWSRQALKDKRAEMGTVEFDRAFRCIALSGESIPCKPHWIKYYTKQLLGDPNEYICVQGYDLAISQKASADYFACVTLLYDPQRKLCFVADAYQGRYTFLEQGRQIIANANRWRPEKIIVERVGLGGNLESYLLEHAPNIQPLLHPYIPRGDKGRRFNEITPVFEDSKILFHPGLDPQKNVMVSDRGDLVGQLLEFPIGLHDDLVDALVTAMSGLQEYRMVGAEEEGWSEGDGTRVRLSVIG